ncbi:transcription factor MYB124-like isoform X1 [Phoenix dactylifera]|uniref:Transcription factor MYB124-like isoform X1 n=1 Tax=Phoenix dactylifera TaxID=42345 RepID=A0A8B9ARH7_PHODC|nr:transcription factor MYB124-like isoform X1 [Phoenix dactylifera]
MERRSEVAAAGMNSDGSVAPAAAAGPSKKDRHIVSWTPKEDDLLREQVALHGTENWTRIAAQFKDKTGRQCRRRWNTYLNAECKKGGWSPEEDRLLCEAQKVYGNRWTEIAKVVSGRTDNAVKNRFSTLCKKRAKHEALSKENNGSCLNPNNKRVIIQNGCITAETRELSLPTKQIRYHISDLKENKISEEYLRKHGMNKDQLRPPLAVLAQNSNIAGELPTHVGNDLRTAVHNDNKTRATFIKKDDPKLTALLQQAELLSSLAQKVNAENTKESLEDAWKEIQDYVAQTEESGMLSRKISGTDFVLDDFRDLIEELMSSDSIGLQSLRQSDLHENSRQSSECRTGSTGHFNTQGNERDHQIDDSSFDNDPEVTGPHEDAQCLGITACQEEVMPPITKPKENDENICDISNSEFASPLLTTPPFQSLAEGIATPKFTSSERRFLLSVIGLPSPAPSPKSSQPPACKKALLDSL